MQLQNLRVAWLTHPFHCCAFKFPSRHDPQRYHQRQQYLAQLKRTCIDNGLIPAANGTQASIDDGLGNGTLDGGKYSTYCSTTFLSVGICSFSRALILSDVYGMSQGREDQRMVVVGTIEALVLE